MHVFLTGERGIGKSTVVRAAARLTGRPCYGFCTRFETEDRHASALYLVPPDYNETPDPSFQAAIWQNGRLIPVDGCFDRLGVRLLKEGQRHPEGIILMDECGHVERKEMMFRQEIAACLNGKIPVLGVLRLGQEWHDPIRRHPAVRVLTVSRENRNELPQMVADLLMGGQT